MVRMNKPIRSFCSAKTCSTRERIFDLALLARRIASSIGRPFGLLYHVSESLTPAADSRIGIYLIHHGKQLSRGLPCLRRFRFALTLTRLACACWRGDRVIPIRPGVSWHWPRFMMAARGRMRHGSAGAGGGFGAAGVGGFP